MNGDSAIDRLIKAQRHVNRAESDVCDIMSTEAGARLLQWSYAVRSTWWYKVFSRIDRRLKWREANTGVEGVSCLR